VKNGRYPKVNILKEENKLKITDIYIDMGWVFIF